MPDVYKGLVDIGMSLDGDFMIDDTGDVGLVDSFEYLYREVNKRLRTNNPSWLTHQSIGCNLNDFIGHPNTPNTARELKQRIKSVMAIDNIAFPGTVDVDVIPVKEDAVAINIIFRIGGVTKDLQQFIYDFSNGVVQDIDEQLVVRTDTPLELKMYRLANPAEARRPNKYQDDIAARGGIEFYN